MAYRAEVLAEAQELYFAGYSAAKIAVELKRRHLESCRKLAEKSVLKWISTPDGEGKTWLDKKAIASAKAEGKRIDSTADRMGQLHGVLDEVIATLQKRFEKSEGFAASNPERTAQVLLQYLGRRAETLRQPLMGGMDKGGQLKDFFEVIQSDPVVGPVFERRRSVLLEAYRKKLQPR